jgi:Tfp pilus assembly protein PilZ
MTILKAHYQSSEAFLSQYLLDLPGGGLFLATRMPLVIGEPVVVSVRMGPRRSPVLLRGAVAWRRPGKHRTKTKAGIGIEFLFSEAQKRDYLLSVARGDSAEAPARKHQRLPVDLPVHWQIPGSLHENAGVLRDIGRGGAFVMTDEPIAGETDVVLKVAPPGAEVAMPVSARIAWVAPGRSTERGFGVAWKARDAGGSRRIKELVRRMERLAVVPPANLTEAPVAVALAQPRSSA